MGSHSRNCLVAASSHGFGHLSQVTPVINTASRLAERQISNHTESLAHRSYEDARQQDINWIVRTSLDPAHVQMRIEPKVTVDAGSDDFGMVMHDALTVDLARSLKRYAVAHANWEREVDNLANHLTDLEVNTVLADVPYLTLAAAQRAGITSLALCSLNWADILQACVASAPCGLEVLDQASLTLPQFERILQTIQDAYNGASVFLQPQPFMPMLSLNNACPIGPVCEVPQPCSRSALNALAHHHGHHTPGWFVMVSMGGIPTRLHPEYWPLTCLGRPVYYLMPPGLATKHPQGLPVDNVSMEQHQLSFGSLFAGCDLFIGKPGYGTFVEAACSGTPLLFLERAGWPESQALIDWIGIHGRATKISADHLTAGEFGPMMASALEAGRLTGIEPEGNRHAAQHLLRTLVQQDFEKPSESDHQSDS